MTALARTAPGITGRRLANPQRPKLKEHIVDRKKPSLTSPWKVGFLVALLLVVTSLGVSYFITGTFGVTWHWIHVGGLSPATWTFNLGAFIEEMAPLLLLTSLLAFGAYVLVAGAVRRYKSYVDSGVEYKQLLKSIKTIEDLEDEGLSDQLKQHPELREFLMGVKHRVAAMERQNAERDRRPAASASSAAREERPKLPTESALLASAIANGRDAFARDLALTVPELKQIERALREWFAKEPATPAPAAVTAVPVDTGELDALRATVRTAAMAIRRDVDACTSGARELESALGGLRASLQQTPAPAPGAKNATVQKRIDATADALATLGEETRRIAIASAMQASGGPEADTIKVADELRTLATRFNAVAQHWRETAPALKELLAANPGSGASNENAAVAAATAVSRARLWTERTIAMTEHARSLERAVQAESVEAAPPMAGVPPTPAMDLADEAVSSAPDVAPDASEELSARVVVNILGSDDDAGAAFVDIPGFEKERKFFTDGSATHEDVPDDRFVVDSPDENRWNLDQDANAPAEAEPVKAAPAPSNGNDSDGFLTGPRPVVSPKKVERAAPQPVPRPAAPEPVTATPATTATLDPDADAIELYELGAVDCVQTA